jgi:hypothetical protein
MTTTELLRRQLEEAYRRWQEAWSDPFLTCLH